MGLFARKLLTAIVMMTLVFTDLLHIINFPFAPEVPTAHAASGDFSIFSNTSDTTTIPAGGAEIEVAWDTVVDESSSISLQSGSTTIDLVEAGKYLVLYNVWADASSGGTNRRSLQTYLTLNETPLAYGQGDGYIRDSGNDDEFAYAAGAAVIEAAAGDDLEVNILRDDTNVTENTTIRSGTNGVSVLRLRDDFDYLRIYKDTRTEDISGNTTFTDVVWDVSDEVDTGSFAFTDGSGDITLKGAAGDYFLVTSNIRLNQDANSSNRANYDMRLTLDGVEVPGTRTNTFLRGNPNTNGIFSGALVYTGIIQKRSSSDEIFNVEVRRETAFATGNPAVDIVEDETALSVIALPTDAEYISLTATSSQILPSSRTALGFDEQLDISTTTFSHSTTSNTSRINIDQAGDFLFFSTAYATRTAAEGSDRDPVRVEWQLDGSTVVPYGGHGSFNRGDQGNYDGLTAGSSGGVILHGLADTQFVEVTAFDEEDAGVSTFNAHHIAVQGVEIGKLLSTDVSVSATGTQTSTSSIPATDVELGGTFVVQENKSSRNLSTLTFTESGSVNGSIGLTNIELWYDLDTTGADGFNCSSESFDGNETQFGDTDTTGFSGADGVSSFVDTVSISTTQTFCGYIVYDVTGSSTDGQTVDIGIADIGTDITVTGGGTVGPGGGADPVSSTVLVNAELTQTHYHWRNDDGTETTATSITGGIEDTPASGFVASTTRRLRLGVSNEGSTTSAATAYRLEYGTKAASCAAVTTWSDIGVGGGEWAVGTSTFYATGGDTTNISVANGGVSDENISFISNNNALIEGSSQTALIVATTTDFLELEFAIQPSQTVVEGATYCFRLTDAGTPLRNYDVYAEANITSDVTVTATGTQTLLFDDPSTDNYVGGAFVITENTGLRTVTDITISASGTLDALASVENVRLFYDTDTTGSFDCSSESFSGVGGGDAQFGSTDSDGFSSANGTATFTDSEVITTSQTLCVYVVLDVTASSTDGETLDVSIASPNTDVLVTFGGTVGPGSETAIPGVTTIQGQVLTQVHYHWRNDNGSEAGATSASGALEDTALTNVPIGSNRRLRFGVSNEGALTSAATTYQLEFGTKVTSCTAVTSWNVVGTGTTTAWSMSDSPNLTHGDNTTNIGTTTAGGVTDENAFLGTNSGVRDLTPTSTSLILTSSDQVELEFSIVATDEAGFDTEYCFRLSDEGNELESYAVFAELRTRDRQDFFIQRGTETISGTSVTLTAGVDYTAPSATSSAFVRITNSKYTGAGHDIDDDSNTRSPAGFTAYIEDQSDITSDFTIARPSATAESVNTRVSWEIVEFVGIAGTDNEMIVRGVDEVTYGGTSLAATGTSVTGVADDSDVVVFITGQFNPNTGNADFNDGLSTSFWHGTSSVPVFTRGDADSVAARTSYAVVEFTGVNWKIQRVEHAYTSITAELESIEAVNSRERTFLHAQKRTGNGVNGLHDAGHLVELSSLGAITFQLHDGTNPVTDPTEHDAVVWVIENTQTGTGEMAVHRSDGTIATGAPEPTSNLIAIGPTVNIDNASIMVTNNSTGAGTAYPRSIFGVAIVTDTQYELWVSDTGQNQDYRTEVIEWPIAEISIRQNDYIFYDNEDARTPTDPWPAGASDLGENTPITALDEPPGEGEVVRIRMTLLINNSTLPAETESYKLQYGVRDSVCSAITVWNDVGAPGSGEIWRGFDNSTPTDGEALSATNPPTGGDTVISITDRAGTYEEQNSSAVNPYKINVGEDVEYDWVVEHNGAVQKTFYCFRMVESDGTELTGYDDYPTLRTSGYSPVVVNWQWFDDENSLTPGSALAAENVAPTDVTNDNLIKLRTRVDEIDGAAGNNVKFKLQYSEDSDFATVFEVVSSTTCSENSLWCYADGAGADDAVIDATVLSGVDACASGVGIGCGTHNEATSTASAFTHGSLDKTEFEFTLQHAGARVNATYYFRLFDSSNDEVVLASTSNPSLVTEGAQLTLTLAGVATSTVTEGVTTDAASAPSGVAFGSVPFNTEFEVAHRVTIDTNATEGYRVYAYARSPLTDSYGNQIATTTGTNLTPLSWAVGCGALPNCFGYHAGDDTLQNSTRFSPADTYAAFTTEPAEIMFSSVPAVSESSDVIYKIEVDETAVAGEYVSDIVYVATPVF